MGESNSGRFKIVAGRFKIVPGRLSSSVVC